MAIEHTCPECQARLRVADENAGKKVRCKCGAVSAVAAAPTAPRSPAAASATQSAAAPKQAAAGTAVASPSQTIAVTCSACQQTIRAPHSAAGKAVRCKCGQVVPVPAAKTAAAKPAATPASAKPAAAKPTAAPRPAAAAPAAAARSAAPARAASAAVAAPVGAVAQAAQPAGSIFDELTEADWNRESPIKRAFAPPAASKDGAVLKKWVGRDMPASRAPSDGIPGLLVFISVVNIIGGALYIFGGVALVALAQAASYVDQLKAALPVLQMGAMLACAYLVFWGVFDLVLGIGLLQRGAWGWCVAAVGYAVAPVLSIHQIVMQAMQMSASEAAPRVAGWGIGVGITVAIVSYIYKDETRRRFGIKSGTPVIVCAIIGVLLGLASVGVLTLMDHAAESMIPADANAG